LSCQGSGIKANGFNLLIELVGLSPLAQSTEKTLAMALAVTSQQGDPAATEATLRSLSLLYHDDALPPIDRPCEKCRNIGFRVVCLRQLELGQDVSCLGHSIKPSTGTSIGGSSRALNEVLDDKGESASLMLRRLHYDFSQLCQSKEDGCHLCSVLLKLSIDNHESQSIDVELRLRCLEWGDDWVKYGLSLEFHDSPGQSAPDFVDSHRLQSKCTPGHVFNYCS
jgi:hypothetical protein